MKKVKDTKTNGEVFPALMVRETSRRVGRPKKMVKTVKKVSMSMPQTITKRDGRTEDFKPEKISVAIQKCFDDIDLVSGTNIEELTQRIINIVCARYSSPTVENVQDIVEIVLQAAGEFDAAKHYILYRAEHAKLRKERPVPVEVKRAFEESDKYFPTQIQKFQFFDKYSRFNYDLGRRETWIETTDRSVNFLKELSQNKIPLEKMAWIRSMILEMKATPSMRLIAMAGVAARRNHIAIYNCSYLPVDSVDSFVEALTISMNGCGVGFSVESKYVENLPRVRRQVNKAPEKFVIPDTTEGWAEAVRVGLSSWIEGKDVLFDFSFLRPAGAILKTKGGRASGPEPLKKMLEFARTRILARQGSFLRTIDAHDIMCEVGNAAVSGGMRRTAMISLFDWDDEEMHESKSGDFERDNSQRWNANNSVVWPERGLTQLEFTQQMIEMIANGRGEPGIFNRTGAIDMRPARREPAEFGCNPCGEINLRPYEFCNLSIAIARKEDTFESLKEKVEAATWIGTIQSMATNFSGLRPIWKKNCEEERLLGVDINGQLDSPVAQDPSVQNRLRQIAIETNRQVAILLGIKQSASVTCVKPSGNSSQLFNCSSGIHARWSPYYIRNVRVGTHTPIFKVLKDSGVPMDPENGQTPETANAWVIHFPIKSPEGSIVRKSRSAIAQCEYWLQTKTYWTEHNPSVTITYNDDEVIDLIKWVSEHRQLVGGMSFLPSFDAKYMQMPYQEITEKEYDDLISKFPNIDFSKLYRYEEEDYTKAAQELACVSGACDIDGLTTEKIEKLDSISGLSSKQPNGNGD